MLHSIPSEEIGPRGEAMANAVGTCVHCGFCLPACPTYQELESEMDSPRGRILLMKSVLEGELDVSEAEPHMNRCLGCLACVSHCPSGVEYGDLISSYRAHTRTQKRERSRLRDFLVEVTLPYASRFRMAVSTGKWVRPFSRMLPRSLQPMVELIPATMPKAEKIPSITPAVGKRKGRVALLAGCAQQVLAPDINAAAVRVLSRQGIEVVCPPNQGCCGALSWHTGRDDRAQRFATDLIAQIPSDVDCLLTTAAGCGSAINEYGLLLRGTDHESQGAALSRRTMDVSVYLDRLELTPIPALEQPLKITYHDACHLAHAQGVRQPPRSLMDQIPGIELIEPQDRDTCCGSAGTYNIEQPEIAEKLGKRKADRLLETGAAVVVTGNIGCLVQIEKQLKSRDASVAVLHTVQVLDRAYRKILK